MSSLVPGRPLEPFGVEIDAFAVAHPDDAVRTELQRLFDERAWC